MGGRETRVNKQADGQTGLSSQWRALHLVTAVTSSESSVGISAGPLNTSQGNEQVGPNNRQHRELDGVAGGESSLVGNQTKKGLLSAEMLEGTDVEEETTSEAIQQ